MAADGGIERGIRETKILHVHQLETHRKAGWGISTSQFDHAWRQVDPHYFAIGRHVTCEAVTQRPRPAGEVEDALAGPGINPLDDGGPTAGLAASHHLVETRLVGGGVPAEGARVQILGGWFVQKKRRERRSRPSA